MNLSRVADIIEAINQLDLKDDWLDLMLISYRPPQLVIAVSPQLEYYHKLEIIFEEVEFLSTPSTWGKRAKGDLIALFDGPAAMSF
jgi:hypothetical protein